MVDEFGLPEDLFGPHPEWFFPALGRVVAVCALLEERALNLAAAIAFVQPSTLTMKPLAELAKQAKQGARGIDEITVKLGVALITDAVNKFFDEAREVMKRRNDVVHSIWPAQPGEEQFGWRPPRAQDDGAVRITSDNSQDSFTDLIRCAVAVVESFPDVYEITCWAVSRAGAAGPMGPAAATEIRPDLDDQ